MSSTNFRPSDPHRASLPAGRHIPSLSTPAAVSGSTTLLSNSYTVSSLDVNLVAFELMFAEIVRYTQQRVDGIGEFEKS
ncbi:hypothetical protein H4Q26_010758 [Puccinia striiformis f. sp. tritici PST-130]|nr:hypothetical protein H4Q26_010758 [Puccinia striiformis f. sp. tritici PST-130]